MTLIRPRNNTFPFALVALFAAIPILAAATWLIISYNNVVDLRHGAQSMKNDLKNLQTMTADLREKEFALLDTRALDALAARNSLVRESNPRYLEVSRAGKNSPGPQWAAALQY